MLPEVLDTRHERRSFRSSHSFPSNENKVLSLNLATAEPLEIRIEVERECLPRRPDHEALGPVSSISKNKVETGVAMC